MERRLKVFFTGLKVNEVIRFLTFSDILMLSGWGLISPIIAVFFAEQIEGGGVALAGLAAMAYFLTKSILQVPVARFIDLKKGEWDDYWIMITGSIIISISAFLYIFSSLPWHVLAIQMLYGIGGALSYPAWLAIFTRHIDKHEEGFEWSLYFSATDVGAAIAGGLGGLLAATLGYDLVFAIVGVMSLSGTLMLAGIMRDIKRRSGAI